MAAILRTATCLLAGILFAMASFGQEEQIKRTDTPAPQVRYYRLEFVVKEIEDDKVINSRVYATSVNTLKSASIRSGTRVPVVTSVNPGVGGSKQYNYYDIGVNIDSRDVQELSSGQLTLTINVDISNLVVTKDHSGDLPPVVRNTKWSSPVVVQIRKATTVFSSDDPSGDRRMQLQLTATPIT